MEQSEILDRHFQFLVYGIERKGLTSPEKPIATPHYTLTFKPFGTASTFQEFDGVMLFQGIFEQFERRHGPMDLYLQHSCDQNELDKRKKEGALLRKKGGVLCFLLTDQFCDNDSRGSRDFRYSDLTKHHLNYYKFHRSNFSVRDTHLTVKVDDFMKFLERYGAASSYFQNYNDHLDCNVIAECNGNMAGMVLHKHDYFLPTLVPDNRLEAITEYFSVLADSLVSSRTKLFQVLPEWIDAFLFDEEKGLHNERKTLAARMKGIDDRIECLKSYKSILALSHQELVDGVINVFRDGFGIAVDPTDELREDFKLVDSNKKPFLLCEVKSTNRGVAREHVNQADSHRERSGFDPQFPSLLIVNTAVKRARSVNEKDQEIAREQVRHARRNNILVTRTLDLLFLLRQYLANMLCRDEVLRILTMNSGWLRVDKTGWLVVTGDEIELSS